LTEPIRYDRIDVNKLGVNAKMQIQLLSIEVNQAKSKAGKPYEQLVVAFKNLTFSGKVESKTLMPFGLQKESFTTLKGAKSSDVYDVEVVKNEAGYNDWIKVTKGSSASSSPTQNSSSGVGTTSTSNTKGGWETPEERAKKQIYIVRQSSISAAVNALSVGVKTGPKAEEVIDYARRLEAFVFESDQAKATVSKDVGSIEELEEDLPF
jgi:hypothetical protein